MSATATRPARRRAALAALLLLAAPAVVRAADGVIEINQASVLASGGFPFHVTAPGSYRLTGRLAVTAAASAIEIDVPDVTLDLNGLSISGSDGPAAISSTAANVVIRNGTVKGFLSGILLSGESARAEGIRAVTYSPGDPSQVGIFVGAGGTVVDSQARNQPNGIWTSARGHVEGATADARSGGDAITATGLVLRNVADDSDNGLDAPFGALIESNVVSRSRLDAIEVGPACFVVGNLVYDNEGAALFSTSSSVGYARNLFYANSSTVVGPAVETDGNLCSGDAICP